MAVFSGTSQGGPIAGAPHGHVNCYGCQNETDDHDNWSHHHRRQDAVQKTDSESFNAEAQDNINKACGDQTAHGGRDAPCLDTINDRCDECKRGGQKNGYHPFGDKLKDEGTRARRKKRDVGVQSGQKRNQYECTKSDKQHLGADNTVL